MLLRKLFHPGTINVQLTSTGLSPTLITVPHVRTLRRSREQVRAMVADGASHLQIKTYLSRWASWWHSASAIWSKENILIAWETFCWDKRLADDAQAFCPEFRPRYPAKVFSLSYSLRCAEGIYP